MKQFHLGDVLSVTTGVLMSPNHMGGVYDILNYMTGDDLYTHQIPRACREVAPVILAQHPSLASVHLNGMPPQDVAPTLARLVAEHGEWWPLEPMTDYTPKHPLVEAVELMDRGGK